VSNSDDVLKEIEKTFGQNVATVGVHVPDTTRIQTGIFPFDLATGGGFPKGRISIVYGPESSLKTTVALKAIATMQKLEPDKKCVFIDVESSYDPDWGASLGVDNDRLIYIMPDYAEQVVDICEAFLYATDVGLVVIDSLAALITTNEAESSAEKAVVGGSGLVVAKLYRKSTLAMAKAKREGLMPTLIAINQIRYKIGVMFGDPETMPGGQSFKFASSLTVRMYGKDQMDKKVHPTLPVYKHCSGIIKKSKVATTARNFEFDLGIVDMPDKNVTFGSCNDWNSLAHHLKAMGLLAKNELKGGWDLDGTNYPKLEAVKEAMYNDPVLNNKMRNTVISVALTGELPDG
jgi:recombination protein RecA